MAYGIRTWADPALVELMGKARRRGNMGTFGMCLAELRRRGASTEQLNEAAR